jgi:enamine deaminase RidA (YjgF/YER057c/UK114 family)
MFVKTQIHTPRLSEAVAAFPRGLKVELDNVVMLFISGTASVGPEGQSCHIGDFHTQAMHTYENIESLLKEQNADFKDIVKFTIYLKDIEKDYDNFNAVRDEFFRKKGMTRPEFPASTCVQARLCRDELLIEIEAIAIIPKRK